MRVARAAALAAVLITTLPAAAQAESWNKLVRSYQDLRIPRVWVTVHDPGTAPGHIFLTPRTKPGQRTGPTILDSQGRVVWFHRLSRTRTAIGLRPQTYRGEPVLTWGQRPPLVHEGDLYSGIKRQVYHVIADQSYRIIARLRAIGRDIKTDLHEFTLTRRNTALVLGFRAVPRNLRRYGGPRRSAILDNVIQEIDVATGRLVSSWSASRRISPRDSYVPPPKTGAWDAYHINAVAEDSDGNWLVTGRHTSTVYKVDRDTGQVIWKLGGKDSSFSVSRSARFTYPHDAQRAPDGTLTIFNNSATAFDRAGNSSRALRIVVDTRTRSARLADAFRHPSGANVFATSQGNATMLPGGNVFVGWGSSPWFSEHAPDGRLLFAGHFQSAWHQSYRAYKGDWVGRPGSQPSVAARTSGGRTAVYVSWNGATEVARWRVLGGTAGALQPLATADKADFETKVLVNGAPASVQVEALDAAGKVIGTSAATTPTA